MNRPIAWLDQINIVSGNLQASLAFYRRLGVEIPEEHVWSTASGIHHASAGETANPAINFELDSIAFARIWNQSWQSRQDLGGRVVVGFKLSSRNAVDAVYGDLTRAGYTGLQAPYDAFWGSRYAVVEDPDGIAVGLMSPPYAELRVRAT